MKPVLVGTFALGRLPVRLWVDQRLDGSGVFDMCPPDGGPAEIRVSQTEDDWTTCAAVLMHEAMELSLANSGCRYCSCSAMNNQNSSDWLFVMDHQLFDRAVYDATRFVMESVDLVRKYIGKAKK